MSADGKVIPLKKLNLKAEGQTEQRLLDYLNENASDVLAEKINAGKKTLGGAVSYAHGEAKKLLASGSNCVAVDDATVFGWVIHFFEEDSIKEGKSKPAAKVPSGVKKQAKPVSKKKVAKKTGPMVLELFSADEMQGRAR